VRRFEGRKAIVTGASRGIGAATAERLAAEGADVVITARTVDRHDHLAGSLNETLARCRRHGTTVEAVAADLADADSRATIVPAALELLGGRVDILVNNAAASMHNPMLTYTLRRRRITFEVNVQAPIDLVQAVVPVMQARGEGWIVNVSSATARMRPGPPYPAGPVQTGIGLYGSSKAALNRLTNAFAVELGTGGVRVNTIEPRSTVLTEGSVALIGTDVDPERVESLEAMVEGVLLLCCCEPGRTGWVHVSLDLLDELQQPVMSLDGTTPYPGGQRPAV
jgi:NAD(P)-dependent dehydrogenase (short-subunit alcohol dehydrogenase family)